MGAKRTVADEQRYLRDRARRLKNQYGIELVEYDLVKAEQGGACAICTRAKGISTPLQVDHDHELEAQGLPMRDTVRGLLCGRDNNRLGWFEANAERVLAYLKNPPARRVLK